MFSKHNLSVRCICDVSAVTRAVRRLALTGEMMPDGRSGNVLEISGTEGARIAGRSAPPPPQPQAPGRQGVGSVCAAFTRVPIRSCVPVHELPHSLHTSMLVLIGRPCSRCCTNLCQVELKRSRVGTSVFWKKSHQLYSWEPNDSALRWLLRDVEVGPCPAPKYAGPFCLKISALGLRP